MNIYNYDAKTGEFLAVSEAEKSPLEVDVFLIPANATDLVPPTPAAGEVAVFKAGAWTCISDQRGEWYDAQGNPRIVDHLGADTSALTRTASPGDFYELMGGQWVLNMPALRAVAIARVREMRRLVFFTLAGMQSEALANDDSATAKAIAAIQPLLRSLPEVDLNGCASQAAVDAAFTAAWADIAGLAPLNVQSAFNEVLAP